MGVKPDKSRKTPSSGGSRGGSARAMDRMADVPRPGRVQLAERLLLRKRMARPDRGDRHQHLVHGKAAGWTEVRAEGADASARRVRIPNELGPGAFRRRPYPRRGRWRH